MTGRSSRYPSAVVAALLALGSGCDRGARRERPAAAAPDASVAPNRPEPHSSASRAGSPGTAAPAAPPASQLPTRVTAAPSVAPDDTARSKPPGEEHRPCHVALIGDSLTDTRIGGGYVRYLAARAPKSRFSNFAKGGAMVNQMKRQLAALAAEPPGTFTHLVVWGGVNDLYSDETAGRTPAKIQRDLSELYAAGRARGLRVVGITVAPWGGFTKYFNDRRSAATRELNAWILGGKARGELDVVVDANSLLSCGDPERLCPRFTLPKDDGLHVGKAGHEVLGEALYEAEFRSCA